MLSTVEGMYNVLIELFKAERHVNDTDQFYTVLINAFFNTLIHAVVCVFFCNQCKKLYLFGFVIATFDLVTATCSLCTQILRLEKGCAAVLMLINDMQIGEESRVTYPISLLFLIPLFSSKGTIPVSAP